MNLFSKKTNQSEEEIVLHAHKKAQAIIKEAVDSAQQLLTQTQLLTDSLKEQTALGMKSAVEAQTKQMCIRDRVDPVFPELVRLTVNALLVSTIPLPERSVTVSPLIDTPELAVSNPETRPVPITSKL